MKPFLKYLVIAGLCVFHNSLNAATLIRMERVNMNPLEKVNTLLLCMYSLSTTWTVMLSSGSNFQP